MKKVVKRVLLGVLALVLVAVIAFVCVYFTRLKSISTLQKLTAYEDYNIYRMDVCYDYDLDGLIASGITDNESFINAILKESIPYLPISMEAPDFGCSAFTLTATDGDVMMGRNYDFKYDSSALLVYCTPKNGYKSVAFAALDNVSANQADSSLVTRFACLTAPFICLDGMNEKGVSIAVLTLDSEPTYQQTGKPMLPTSLLIRLVLDRAASTEEAVELISQYDMFATSGRDYHFYITDASGDGRVIEYDCDSETRALTVTPSEAVTNFFIMYKDQVLPNQKNGNYGHGRERYDAILATFEEDAGNYSKDTAWKALKNASQAPNPEDITSNTQWSIVFNNTDLTLEISLRRDWNTVVSYSLTDNTIIQ